MVASMRISFLLLCVAATADRLTDLEQRVAVLEQRDCECHHDEQAEESEEGEGDDEHDMVEEEQ
jgi:hypothetical protein